MKRTWVVAAALCAAGGLAGCPLPQPLAEYPKGQPVTPPRIVTTTVTPADTTIFVPAGCTTTAPQYTLAASLIDINTADKVTARWFVDYVPDPKMTTRVQPIWHDDVPAAPQPIPTQPDLSRVVPPQIFYPYTSVAPIVGGITDPRAAGNLHVVELVVSNDPSWPADTATPLPYRSPTAGYETQVYRWVFLVVDPATNPGVTCPP